MRPGVWGDTFCLVTHSPAPLALDAEACVTASDLVRQFGAWQERAIRHPVFVMRRGRPSLVLTSFDLMQRLCAGHQSDAASLLDAMEESVLTIDGGGCIRAANRAAQRWFSAGGTEMIGLPLSRVITEPAADFILERSAMLRPGDSERMDVEIGDRQFRIILTHSDDGTLLIATDITDEARSRTTLATHAALSASAAAAGVATARLDRNGAICDANEVLAALSKTEPAAMHGLSFGQLVAPPYRPCIERGVRQAIVDGGTHSIEVEFDSPTSVAAQIALTGIRLRSRIEGVAVAIRPL